MSIDTEISQDKVDHLRKKSEARFLAICKDSDLIPEYIFTKILEKDIKNNIHSSSVGTIFVSFHNISYFLLFNLIEKFEIKCYAVVNENIAEKFRSGKFVTPAGLECVTTLAPHILRDCQTGRAHIFIMADVLYPGASATFIPIMQRAMFYTITWAEIACRLGLNICPLFIDDRGNEAAVYANFMKSPANNDPYGLAYLIGDEFTQFMIERGAIWENGPLFEEFGVDLGKPDDPKDILRTLWHLSKSHYRLSKICNDIGLNLKEFSGSH